MLTGGKPKVGAMGRGTVSGNVPGQVPAIDPLQDDHDAAADAIMAPLTSAMNTFSGCRSLLVFA